MKKYLPSPALLAILSTSALMLACGDGSTLPQAGSAVQPVNPPVASTTEIPLSATTSAGGAFSFVNLVASNPQDSAEPLEDGDAVLASSETDEPDLSV